MPDGSPARAPLPPTKHPESRFADLRDVARLGLVGLVLDRSAIGDVFALDLMGIRPMVIKKPEHLRHVLVDRAEAYPKGPSVDTFRLIVGDGLFTADGEPWRAHRTLLQPYFRKSAVERYAPHMVDGIVAVRERWEGLVGGEIDALDEMMELALEVVGRAMFSRSIAGGERALAYHYKRALALVGERSHSLSFPLWMPTPANVRLRWHVSRIDRAIYGEMKDRRSGPRDRKDYLEALLEAGEQGMTDLQIRDELATLIIAGHETTAITMAWVLHLLSRHPEAEAAVARELETSGVSDIPEPHQLGRLPYLRAVVDEAMRLYPPVWINPRTALEDDVIGGFRVRAGDPVLLGVYLTHRDPALFPEPDSFVPERFLREPPDRFAFVPFGVGGRTCAGLAFAYQEMLMSLATLLGRFRVEQASDREPELAAVGTLQPKHGLPLRLERR